MRYLSLDLEATGLNENDRIIEFATVPFCVEKGNIETSLKFHSFIKCPSFEQLSPGLSPWVRKHNKKLINKAHSIGVERDRWKSDFTLYLQSKEIQEYFHLSKTDKIVLCGKSMSSLDIPFLNRELGWDYMRHYFHHQTLDISCLAHLLVDTKKLPPECVSGKYLMQYFNMGDVSHTALEDAINVAKLYLAMVQL